MEMEPASCRSIFWGLVVKPGKRYETEVQEPFRITKACLEPATAGGKVSSVMVECDNNEEFIIANLNGKLFNETLDLAFNEGEKICFKVDGPGTVHLTGNLIDSPEDEEGPGMFDMMGSESEEESEVEEAGERIKEMVEKAPKRKKEEKIKVPAKKAKVEGDTTVDTSLGDLDDTDNFAEEEDSDEDDSDGEDDSDDDNTNVTTDIDTTANRSVTTGDDSSEEDDSDDDDDVEEVETNKTKEEKVESPTEVAEKTSAKLVKTPKGDAKKAETNAVEDSSDDEDEEKELPAAEPKKTKETPAAEPKKTKETPAAEPNKTKEKVKAAIEETPKNDKTKGTEAKTKTPKAETKTPKADGKTPKAEAKTPKVEIKTPKADGKTLKTEAKTPKAEIKTPKADGKTLKTEAKTPKAEVKTPKAEAKTPNAEAKSTKVDNKTPKVEVKTTAVVKEPKTPMAEVKTPKTEAKTPKELNPKPADTPGKTPKRTVKGGVQVEELMEGTGQECRPGNIVGMFYAGKLKSNNTQFDACVTGKPFKFKLGGGQVIKGWDVGILGMKVGGKRRLTIPPAMGYGTTGSPPEIPPNAALVFDIECKYVK